MMKTLNGIVLKFTNAGARGVMATLASGEEVRVSHRDYWKHIEDCSNMPTGYEGIPYMNSLHLITIPNPVYQEEEE